MAAEDVTATPSVAPEETAENSHSDEAASAETLNAENGEVSNGETVAAEEEIRHPIPYDRFASTVDEKNAAIEEARALRERITTLERGTPASPAEETAPAEPPEHLSQREKVRWYVRNDAAELIKSELGMELGEAKALLQTVPAVSQSSAQRQWEEACGKHKLDPEDKMVQNFARGLVKNAGHGLDEALQAIKSFGGRGTAASPKADLPPQRMLHDPSTGAMTGKATPIVFDRKEASKLAQRGERAPDAAALDILSEVKKRRSAKR